VRWSAEVPSWPNHRLARTLLALVADTPTRRSYGNLGVSSSTGTNLGRREARLARVTAAGVADG